LSGYRARRRVADSWGPVMWQACLWINRRPWTNFPTPRC
jgi:hypothetical protein